MVLNPKNNLKFMFSNSMGEEGNHNNRYAYQELYC